MKTSHSEPSSLRGRSAVSGFLAGFGLVSLFFLPPYAAAVPASPEPVELSQADGSKIKVVLRGDEFCNWHEDEGGYTILKDTETKNWVYAEIDRRGGLKKSAHKVGKAEPRRLGLPRHTLDPERISAAKVKRAERDGQGRGRPLSGAAPPAGGPRRAAITQGTMRNLVILARFSDQSPSYTQPQFDSLFNQVGYTTDGAAGSVRDFYTQVSYGKLTLLSTVPQWVILPQTAAYYGADDGYGNDANPRQMVIDAINALDAAGFDFTSVDGNGDGEVDGLTIIHSGRGEEYGGNSTDYIWSHQWALAAPVYKDGIKMQLYHTEPEVRGVDSSPASWGITRIGVICHETAHFLGLPDLYDYDKAAGSASMGAGQFCLMAAGSWNGNLGTSPAQPSAWCKTKLNWVTPTTLNSSGTYSLARVEDSNTAIYKFSGASFAGTEYFLMENKQGFGFDAGLPGFTRGILIWHIDETVANNNDQTHYKVDLEEASGTQDLEQNTSYGNDLDYFRSNTMASFGDNSSPNSRSYAGASLGWSVQNISGSGNPMNFSFEPAGGAPAITRNPGNMTFIGSLGGANPNGQNLYIYNSGGGALNWSVSSNAAWLTIAPASGSSAGETDAAVVSANTTGLAAGTYTAAISIAAAGASNTPQTTAVTLTVANAGDAWDPADNTAASGTQLTPSATGQAHGPHTLSATDLADWYRIAMTAGYTYYFDTVGGTGDNYGELFSDPAATNRVKYDDDSVGSAQFSFFYPAAATQTYYLKIRAYSSGGNWSGSLNYYYVATSPEAVISRSPASMTFTGQQGGTNPAIQYLYVSNTGGGALNWSVTDNAAWLTLSPSTGSSTGETDNISVSANTGGLAAGTYYGTIAIAASSATNTPQTTAVTLTVSNSADVWDPADNTAAGGTQLTPSTTGQTHGPHTLGGTDLADWFRIDMTAGYTYYFDTAGGAGDNYGELYSDPAGTNMVKYNDDSGGSVQFSFFYTAPATQTYYLKIRLYSSGSPWSGSLNYRYAATPPETALARSPASMAFTGLPGGTNPAGQYLFISNPGGGTLNWSVASTATWLTIFPSSGSSTGETDLAFVSANVSGLSTGTYNAQLTIAAAGVSNAPQTTAVTLLVAVSGDTWDPVDNSTATGTQLTAATSVQSHGPHTLDAADLADWFRINMTAGYTYHFNTVGGTGDNYGELFSGTAGGLVAYNDDSGGSQQFRFDYTAAATQTYYLRIRGYSSGGNWSGYLNYSYSVLSPPTITSITPASGLNTGSVNITNLSGTRFETGAAVKLSRAGQPDIAATNVVWVSTSRITCTFPVSWAAAGAWNVTVTNPDSQAATLINGFTVTLPAPTVASITPLSSLNNASANITDLAGTWFVNGAAVKLTKAGQPDITATNVVRVSAARITCTFPVSGAAPGAWNVSVTNPDTQSATLINGFTVIPPPPDSPGSFSGEAVSPASIKWLWPDVSLETGYRVLSATGGILSGSLAAGTTYWLETGRSTNSPYSRRLLAYNTGGESAQVSAIAYTLAIPPAGVSATPLDRTVLRTGWGASGNPPQTFYELNYSSDPASYWQAVSTGTTAFDLTDLLPGKAYSLKIRALNGSGIPTSFSDGTVAATLSSPEIASLSGVSSGQNISLTIKGSDFCDGDQVRFEKAGQASVYMSGSAATAQDHAAISAAVDVTGLAAGAWNVVVYNADATDSGASGNDLLLVSTVTLGGGITQGLIDSSMISTLTIPGGIEQVIVPPGILPNGFILVSTNPETNPITMGPATIQAATQALRRGQITFSIREYAAYSNNARVNTFAEPLSFAISYPDALPADGIVDGTGMKELDLRLMTLDEAEASWVEVPSSEYELDAANNTVTARRTHFSTYALLGFTPAGDVNLSKVYPVPWEPNSAGKFGSASIAGCGSGLIFEDLPGEGAIRIYTIPGDLVREISFTSSDNGCRAWDGKNASGRNVASGVYIAIIKNKGTGGGSTTKKLAIER